MQNEFPEKALKPPSARNGVPRTGPAGLHDSEVVFQLAFHLVMNKVGADLKEDLISRLKEQGLSFDRANNPRMTLQELEAGLIRLLGAGSSLIIKYIDAEMQRLS